MEIRLIAVLLIRLFLSSIFLLAGITKLFDLESATKAIEDFGVSKRFSFILSSFLIGAELLVATLLLFSNHGQWGAISAVALLTLFSVAIISNLLKGRTPECHCFGQFHSEPIGIKTLVRNSFFMGCAFFLWWQSPKIHYDALKRILSALTTYEIVMLGVAIVLIFVSIFHTWAIYQLFRLNGRLLIRVDAIAPAAGDGEILAPAANKSSAGLPIGSTAPEFELPDLSGAQISLTSLLEGGLPVLLIFSDSECKACQALLPDISRWQSGYRNDLKVALVTNMSAKSRHLNPQVEGVENILIQTGHEVAKSFNALLTPSAVLVQPNLQIGSYMAVGPQAITQLVSELSESKAFKTQIGLGACPKRLQVGDLPTKILLNDLDGNAVPLIDPMFPRTLVLFWNPACGYCTQMLPDLRKWETSRPVDGLKVLVVSRGSREVNVAMGLQSQIVLDQGFEVGRTFGVPGTPSAVILNEQGKIISPVKVGQPAIFALVGNKIALSGI